MQFNKSNLNKKQKMKTKNMTTLHLRKSIGRSPLRLVSFLIAAALCCFALSVQAVSPPPDGGYPGANTAEGQNALQSLSSGVHNTALGYQTLFSDTTGNFNTATGSLALFSNTTGSNNTANGLQALYSNTTGSFNTANGNGALVFNTTGSNNTANGRQALFHNTTGSQNSANGSGALFSNTTGSVSTANGYQSLYSNTTGVQNTANGFQALFSNTDGYANTANGYQALYSNTTGAYNTANGVYALPANTTGNNNTANGYLALFRNTTGSHNTANGQDALSGNTTGNDNIAVGYQAGDGLTTGNDNIDIGSGSTGGAGEANTIRIGRGGFQTTTYIAGIFGATASGGTAVYVNSSGQLGTVTSSARFKQDIHSMDKASEAILALKPVTFRYKRELDPAGIPQFGLVAEEVAEVDPDLVVRDAEGKPYTVRYEAVNAMLLNEFLKEHRTVQELKSIVAKQEVTEAQQQEEIRALTTTLKEQASQIQKVSAQLELGKSTPQMAGNDR